MRRREWGWGAGGGALGVVCWDDCENWVHSADGRTALSNCEFILQPHDSLPYQA